MLLSTLVLLFVNIKTWYQGVSGILLLPGASYSKDKTDSVSIPGFNNYMPQKKDFRTKRLLRKMGSSFDEEWMSIENPDYTTSGLDDRSDLIRKQTQLLAIREEIAIISPDYLENNATVTAITNFLMKMSTCRVTFEWEDIGVLFWPRYIKTGMCISSGSCSWPPGMNCVSEGQKTLYILRWRCKRKVKKNKKNKKDNCSDDSKGDSKSKGRIRCKWKRVPFTVTTGCVCSCLGSL